MSPILAASNIEVWPFVAAAVVLLIKWLASGPGSTQPPPPPPPPGRSRQDQPRRVMSEEEERARRFMEALGLPVGGGNADPAPPSLPSSQTPTRREQVTTMRQDSPPPVPQRRKVRPVLPVPPIVADAAPWSRKGGRLVRPEPPPLRREPASLDSLEAPSLPVEQIRLAPLETPAYHEFKTKSSEVMAIPFERTAAADAQEQKRRHAGALDVRALLKRGDMVRAAIVLREILGPPRGLQSSRPGHSFNSP
jgi:hypothetical protein